MSIVPSRLRLLARPVACPSYSQCARKISTQNLLGQGGGRRCHRFVVYQEPPWRRFGSTTDGATGGSSDNDSETAISDQDLELALAAVEEQQEQEQQSVDGALTTSNGTNLPGSQTGGEKMAIVFTCKVCNTRSAKQFTKRAYNHGVVIIKCPGCSNQHLIADRLKFFEDEEWDIERAMKATGDKYNAVNDDNVMELTMKDILGDRYDQALKIVSHDVTELGSDEDMMKGKKLAKRSDTYTPW